MVKTKKSLTGADFLEWRGMKNAPDILPGAEGTYRDSSASFTAARVMPSRIKKAYRIRG